MKKTFNVTEKAGAWVAGRRSPGSGKPITLTEEQARYPLIAGEIALPAAKTTKPKTEKSGD